MNRYESAREQYAAQGVDTEEAIRRLSDVKISMHCWQGDDVRGFENAGALTGGIQATGNYPGAARTPQELMRDLDEAFSMIPGRHRVNVHAFYGIYPDGKPVDRDQIKPEHFRPWVDYAKARGLGLDFNPTYFSHPLADGGTLLLDEIGDLPLDLQAKLLRALQQGEVQRVGSDSPITVDVRVIAATNRNLREEVEQKRFREDLFFRLNVISIEVPALRERSEDIPLLAAHFLEKFAARNRKNVKGFAPQALDMLRRYSWPGNVRELQNAVERAVILCTGDLITGPELPASVTGAAERAAPVPETAEASLAGLSLEALERRAIEDTLRQTEDNKSEAARRLGITRATLHNKLRKYGLE